MQSEAFSLTWGHIDWERGRLSIPSPKTEHQGKSHRVIPLFPDASPSPGRSLRGSARGQGLPFPGRLAGTRHAPRIVGPERTCEPHSLRSFVGLASSPWPQWGHSLRASCESDLAQSFPLATVTKWLGNTPSVALRHYVDPTEAAFDRALEWRPSETCEIGRAHV